MAGVVALGIAVSALVMAVLIGAGVALEVFFDCGSVAVKVDGDLLEPQLATNTSDGPGETLGVVAVHSKVFGKTVG